jgi:hypothetical protein
MANYDTRNVEELRAEAIRAHIPTEKPAKPARKRLPHE